MVSLALLAACTPAKNSTTVAAPSVGTKSDSPNADVADTSCQIVLDTAARVPDGKGGWATDCSTGVCWFVFNGSIDVAASALTPGTSVGVLYYASGTWFEQAATDDGTHRFNFTLSKDTADEGESPTSLSTFQLQLIPVLHTATGGRVFDHNGNPDPFSNYVLDSANNWSVGTPGRPVGAACSTATSQPDTECRVVLRHVAVDVTKAGEDNSVVWTGAFDLREDIAALGGPNGVGFRSNAYNIWTEVGGSPSNEAPVQGFKRFDFSLYRNTVDETSETAHDWVSFELQLIPSVQPGGTVTWYDHNFPNVVTADNPDANYVLAQALNNTSYTAPSNICPAR